MNHLIQNEEPINNLEDKWHHKKIKLMIAKKEEEKIKEFINKASERNISINSEN